MKKKIGCEHFPEGKWRKILLIMKLKLFILLCCIHTLSATTYSQDQKLDVKFENELIVSVLDYLKMQTGYQFFFQKGIVSETEKITVDLKNATLNEVLDKVLKDHGYSYEVLDGVIIVRRMVEQKQAKKTLVGIVTDQKKVPMPGVTVKISGTSVGTATNVNGQFSLTLPMEKGALEFSFVGYKSQKVNFTGLTKDTLRVVMEEDIQALDEAVVVAYGTTTRRKATGAVSVVKAEEFKGIPSANIANLLQGRVAGMDIVNLSGAPGGGDMAITVRGYNSMDVEAGRRFSNPLWVVDGVPLNSFTSPVTGTNLLSDLNPDMIESIQILKDASSAAIYGSRAANGVIIVTTKKGRQNQDAKFSVNFSESWSVLPEFPAVTTGRAERLMRLRMLQNDYAAYLDTKTNSYKYPENLQEQYENPRGKINGFWYPDRNNLPTGNGTSFQDSLNSFYNNSTNFFPIYFETGKVTNANIQAYGGSERVSYGLGLGYYNESGVFKGTGFKRFDLNSNMTVIPVKRLNVDLRFNASLAQKKRASSSMDGAMRYSGAVVPVETIPGDPYSLSTLLPGENSVVWDEVLKAYEGTRENNRAIRLRANFRLGYDIIEGLNISTSLAVDYAINRRNYFAPSYLASDNNSITIGETGINLMVLNENLLSYKKTIREDHTLDFLAGFSYQYDQEEYNGGSAQRSPSDKIYYAPQGMPDLGTVTWENYTETKALKNYTSDMQEKSLISYFARLEYGFKEKYLFSASFRRDGSSTFGRDNRWGTFPSVAAAWSFSEENFVKDNLGWLSFGKFRVSWGRSGMHFSNNYLALGIMQVGGSSYLGNSILEPEWSEGLYNDELSWEETDQYDFGLDVDMFEHRLGITLDYYYRYTDKLLNKVDLPGRGRTTGYRKQWRNVAAVSNEGIEMMVKYEIFRKKDLFWKVSVNMARNWNRFEKSYTGVDINGLIIGKSLNGIYALKTDGYVDYQSDVPVYFNQRGVKVPMSPRTNTTAYYKPGDYRFVDVNGDRKITTDDAVYCGSTLLELTGGIVSELRWKNFDVNLLMSFQLGRHMLDDTKTRALSSMSYLQYNALVMDLNEVSFWEKPGDNTDYPLYQMDNFSYQFYGANVDRHVEKVNWLKIKTLTVGYSLPEKWIKKAGLSELRVFASGENLYTFTNYSGVEPEVVDIRNGIDSGNAYPLARKLTLGLTLKF